MGVEAAVAVAVVDDDHDRQVIPEVLGIQAGVVGGEVALPAQKVVEMPTRGKHDAVVSCHDPVAAESRHVHAIVEPLPVDHEVAPVRLLEGQRDPAVRERPHVTDEFRDR